MRFNKLDVPYQWKNEFTKYPHGYTIFEALCSWTKQVDSMVDNQNSWNDYLENFVENFDFELQEEVKATITRWQNEGLLEDIISSAINTRIDEIDQRVTTQLDDYASKIRRSDFLVTGHRGFIDHAPENTLAGFHFCYAYGVDGFEFDVHQLQSGEFVVIHDSTVDRTTNGTGSVVTQTLQQIKALDAGSWKHSDFTGEQIPTVDEVLDFAKGKFKRLYLEVKSISSLSALYDIVKSKDMLDIVSFHSFMGALDFNYIRELDSTANISIITSGGDFDNAFIKAKEVNAIEMDIDWNWLKNNKHKINDIHTAGIRVFCWNTLTHQDMLEAVEAGVDGLNLDNPAIWIKGGH